ncbi:MAG: RidA family protein [Chloroflexi bacterium]|nr:MAG: RidA family protein [Chloroflexota bacterium]
MSERQIIATTDAPKAVGPYSQAVRAGGFVFVAGQIGLDPATGQMVEGGIAAQTRQALENLRAILEAAGSGLDRVVKTTVYMADLNDFPTMNGIYAEFFPQGPPARATVGVAALPLGALVEIEAIALA